MFNFKDLKVFEALYKEHFAFFSLVSFSIVKDKDVAKDLVQDLQQLTLEDLSKKYGLKPDTFIDQNLKRINRNPSKYKEYMEKVKENRFLLTYGAGNLKYDWKQQYKGELENGSKESY